MSGPTFVATFIDGVITRMTTHCPNGKLDLGRGVRLARAAYRVRKRARARRAASEPGPPPEPPALEAGCFVTRGDDGADVVLKSYTAEELLAAVTEQPS